MITAEKRGLLAAGHLTIDEACERIRVSRTTLYSLMEQGQLAYLKIGKRRFVPRTAIENLLERGLVVAG